MAIVTRASFNTDAPILKFICKGPRHSHRRSNSRKQKKKKKPSPRRSKTEEIPHRPSRAETRAVHQRAAIDRNEKKKKRTTRPRSRCRRNEVRHPTLLRRCPDVGRTNKNNRNGNSADTRHRQIVSERKTRGGRRRNEH